MSDTPRTDKEAESAMYFEAELVVGRDFARELERELNEALKDKERLDWMLSADDEQLNELSFWDREEIDKAMEESK